MKSVVLCTFAAFAFFVASAVAQVNTPTDAPSPSSQGTQTSTPDQASPGSTTSPNGSMSGTQNGNMSNGSMSGMKGDKKMKGCIQSQGGQYTLQSKRGSIPLTGQDVSAHVGHEVTVHGMWSGSNGNMSNTSSTNSGMASGKSFNVTSVDMISETCTMTAGK